MKKKNTKHETESGSNILLLCILNYIMTTPKIRGSL